MGRSVARGNVASNGNAGNAGIGRRGAIATEAVWHYQIRMSKQHPFHHLLAGSVLGLLLTACDNPSSPPQGESFQEVAAKPKAESKSVEPVKPAAEDPAPAAHGLEPRVKAVETVDGGAFDITYEWHVGRQQEEDWRVFVHFTDANGVIVFQNDHDAVPPVASWEPGRVLRGPHRVQIPEGFAGTVEIRMGLYQRNETDGGTSVRAELDGADDGERRIVVGRLEIDAGKVVFHAAD